MLAPVRGRPTTAPAPPHDPNWWVGTQWEGPRVAGLFDATWYQDSYPDAVAPDVDPMWHYVSEGAGRGLDPNPLFSTSWYLTTYPDVAAVGIPPLVHYCNYGVAEGRDPGPRFSTTFYLGANADVRVARINPLAHYLLHGEAEGRRPRPLPTRRDGSTAVNAVFVSGEPTTPGHHYRVVQPAEAIRHTGGRATILTVPEAAVSRLAALDDADVVVLWRVAWQPPVERIVQRARRSGAVIVFDIDDLMVEPSLAVPKLVDGIRSQGLTEQEAQEWFDRMGCTAREADTCTATTAALANGLRHLGNPVYVVPNGYDDQSLIRSRLARRVDRQTPDDGLCRIGYAAGSRTHQRDLAIVAEPLAKVLQAHEDARLVLFRDAVILDEFPALLDLQDRVEWRELVSRDDLPSELARFDINIAPLETGNAFCEAKSDLKFFEAALVEVATIASPTGAYRSAITNGLNGLLASGPDDWVDALSLLLDDERVRSEMGRAAYRSVLWPYGPGRRAQQVRAVIEQLLGTHGAAEAFELELLRADRKPDPEPPLGDARIAFTADRLREARVTVVVPVHDYEGVLEEALESVREQTLDDLDLIIVDDASTDGSLEVAQRWLAQHAGRFNRALLLTHSRNTGVARTRNDGFDAAETPFVLPLDADNRLLLDACAQLLEALAGSAASFAYPRIRHFGEDTDLFSIDDVRGYLPYEPQRLVGSNYIDAMALIRKDAWAVVGGYREGLAGWEDYDLWCRFAERGLYGTQVARDLGLYRVHQASMLHTLTHRDDHLARVHAAISREHPWLHLSPGSPADHVLNAPPPVDSHRPVEPRSASRDAAGTPAARTSRSDGLSERSRQLLPLLRCPETQEGLEECDDGIRSVQTGRLWPVVDGRPVLFPDRPDPESIAPGHTGNPLPDRARDLVSETTGMILHLSGGGTPIGSDQAVELDGALFDPTDLVADAHRLPFDDDLFDLVLALNAFEHYAEPTTVAREIRRVLRPGGLVFVHTAFLQPLHEEPHHYYNSTRFGLERWFSGFETVDLGVSENFNPAFSIAWLASDTEAALVEDVSDEAGNRFRSTTLGTFADYWRDPPTRIDDERWDMFAKLGPSNLERLAAGFEYLGRVGTDGEPDNDDR